MKPADQVGGKNMFENIDSRTDHVENYDQSQDISQLNDCEFFLT